jgi:hypothetical protein
MHMHNLTQSAPLTYENEDPAESMYDLLNIPALLGRASPARA